MPEIQNLSNAALLVLDWQLFFVSPESPAYLPDALGIEGNVCALVDSFLAARKRVVATRHGHARDGCGPFLEFYGKLLYEDDPLAELAPFLRDRLSIRTIRKDTYSAFASSDLAEKLKAGGVETLVIAGLQTDKCIVANALAAFDRGFRVVVAEDACVARDRERHLGALRLLERSCARVATAREIRGAIS